MKLKIQACIGLILMLIISMFSFSSFAETEIFDVNISEEGNVSVKYYYPYYRNSDVSFVISENSTREIIYFEQYKLNNLGVLTLSDIKLPKGGEYTISIYPENRGSVLSVVKNHFTDQDKLDIWNIAATSTDSKEISDNWSYIESVLGFSVPNLDFVISDSAFFDKIATQRTGDHSAKTDENHNALTEYFNQMALCTAFEQNTDLSVLETLFSMTDFTVSSDAAAISDNWNKISSDGDYNLLLDIFGKKEKSIDSVDDLTELMSDSIAEYKVTYLLKALQNAQHVSQVSPLLTNSENASILGISDLVASYSSLGDTTAVDLAIIGVSFASQSQFRQKFSEALTIALDKEDDNSQSTQQRPQTSGKPGSSWVGSSSGGGSTAVSPSPSPSPAKPASPFTDLEDFKWAQEHINMLYNLGIISGKSANLFAPADNITREEITKLIVCLFKLKMTERTNSFSDVVSSSWYEDYVYTAASNGITQGIGNDLFGVGLNASRQDIAVMLAKALEICGFELSSMQLSFDDEAEISDYARKAAEALCAEGIITGDDFNRFNPQSSATRAETAVMISRIYTKFIKESR